MKEQGEKPQMMEREAILEERLAIMEKISKAVSSTLDIDELLVLLMDQITTIMRAERSTLFLVDREKKELWSKVLEGEDRLTIHLPLGTGIAGQVALDGEMVNLEDAYSHPNFNKEIDRQTGFRTRAVLAVPLRNNRGDVSGVVQVLNRLDGRAFSDSNASLLEAIASQISMALENAALYSRVVTRNLELDALYDIEQEISGAIDPESIIDRVLEKSVGIMEAEAGSILLKSDEDSGKLFFRSAGGGEKGKQLHGHVVKLGRGIVGWVAQYGSTARVNDVRKDSRFDSWLADFLNFPARQILAVPLSSKDDIIGAVEMINKKGTDHFSEEDERLLRLLGTQIARAVILAREALEKLQKERLQSIGRMLAGVLHDFRTPMTVVTTSVEMMIEEKREEKRNTYAERALNQLDVLNQMTKDLMAFARGERNIFMRKVYMQKFMDELIGLVTAEFEGSSVDVRWRREYEGLAYFDPDLMRRVLLNISRNALQAMPGGGELEIAVEASEKDGTLTFLLGDNGPGIPEEIRENLFEAFVTSGKEDGTGLGLAIVKKAVNDHMGCVEVETAEGRGTVFEITLPLRKGS